MCKNCRARQKIIQQVYSPGQISFLAWTSLRGFKLLVDQEVQGETEAEARQAAQDAVNALANTGNALEKEERKYFLSEAKKIGLDLRLQCNKRKTKENLEVELDVFESNVILDLDTLNRVH
jgi:hypothetical protein